MAGIQPFEGETRIAKPETIDETLDAVVATSREVSRANDSLDELNDSLKTMSMHVAMYKEKSAEAKRMMRRLSTEL